MCNNANFEINKRETEIINLKKYFLKYLKKKKGILSFFLSQIERLSEVSKKPGLTSTCIFPPKDPIDETLVNFIKALKKNFNLNLKQKRNVIIVEKNVKIDMVSPFIADICINVQNVKIRY